MTSYPATSLDKARKFLSEKSSGSAPDLEKFFDIRGHGDSVDDALANLSDALESKALKGLVRGEFDAVARPMVHQALSGIGEDALSDQDFWRYLASVRFNSVVAKRHPKTGKSGKGDGLDGNWANYGALRADVRESLFFRLYTGADLAYDPAAEDPYHLSRVSDVDLWQSHIIRVMSGDNPAYVRALLNWFQSRASWRSELTEVDCASLFAEFDYEPDKRHLRDLVKRVRRLRSNVVHEFLLDEEVAAMVSHEAMRSLQTIERWGKSKTQ